MSSVRCARCDINYPSDYPDACPICEVELFEVRDSHDSTWREQVKRWQDRIKPGDYIVDVNEPVLVRDGQSFIADVHLRDAGYYSPEVGDVVSIQHKFYELGGVVYPDSEAPGWWLQLIDPDKEVRAGMKGHKVMSEVAYERLEKSRIRQ